MSDFGRLNERIVACRRCPRLIRYIGEVARVRRAAFTEWTYWGRPVPNFGDPAAKLLIVGLAPAAHGANRTGRMFTGDRSGQWLYRALFKAGFANQPESITADDGLRLTDCMITAVCHCAPPDNKPTPEEIANCQTWLTQTIDLCRPKVMFALGHIAWNAVCAEARRRGWLAGARPTFSHAAAVTLENGYTLLGSYHPSQQNTFTGRLTEPMFDAVFRQARKLVDSPA
jgi:uracil-DNA glycosylase